MGEELFDVQMLRKMHHVAAATCCKNEKDSWYDPDALMTIERKIDLGRYRSSYSWLCDVIHLHWRFLKPRFDDSATRLVANLPQKKLSDSETRSYVMICYRSYIENLKRIAEISLDKLTYDNPVHKDIMYYAFYDCGLLWRIDWATHVFKFNFAYYAGKKLLLKKAVPSIRDVFVCCLESLTSFDLGDYFLKRYAPDELRPFLFSRSRLSKQAVNIISSYMYDLYAALRSLCYFELFCPHYRFILEILGPDVKDEDFFKLPDTPQKYKVDAESLKNFSQRAREKL